MHLVRLVLTQDMRLRRMEESKARYFRQLSSRLGRVILEAGVLFIQS